MQRTAVILFNLGGPSEPSSIRPFLRNLFSDPAILRVPGPVRFLLSRYIAFRRAVAAREIYAHLGGKSPILEQTRDQAARLEARLGDPGTRVFVCMRYWHPMSDEVAAQVRAYGPDRIILLPLYPQFSTSTTASSFQDWFRAAAKVGITADTKRICCYPDASGFVSAIADGVREGLRKIGPHAPRRVIFSAHGVPVSFIRAGDPYQHQVERTVMAVAARLELAKSDYVISYQSRVGRLEWLQPYTDSEIVRAGQEGKAIVMVPVAFVSEHSETLVELDIEYAALAQSKGVPEYVRVATVSAAPDFIDTLAELVRRMTSAGGALGGGMAEGPCPAGFPECPRAAEAQAEA